MQEKLDRISTSIRVMAKVAMGRSGWGSHYTTVPHKEIGAGLLASMLKDLNIDRKDF